MLNLLLNKNIIPYLLIAAILGYIYYQHETIENQKIVVEKATKEINSLKISIEEQKQYFEDKIKQENFKVKYIEKKQTIEQKVKKDETDTTKSISNRFYLN